MISRDSGWRRWEPHIHTPATLLDEQFRRADPWGANLKTLEGLMPKVEAVAVTDYHVTDTYGPNPSGGLPPIGYVAGSLENAAIRKAVCDILEGGESAFRERAWRLRVRLDR